MSTGNPTFPQPTVKKETTEPEKIQEFNEKMLVIEKKLKNFREQEMEARNLLEELLLVRGTSIQKWEKIEEIAVKSGTTLDVVKKLLEHKGEAMPENVLNGMKNYAEELHASYLASLEERIALDVEDAKS